VHELEDQIYLSTCTNGHVHGKVLLTDKFVLAGAA